ncbi:sensor histidine kinase [Altererythrobacter aquiaggeris]|uniref:sensor histidine kinase n=1 Tax=Aestuarierythrobacter aquiaggeris TaxID=1898396 RepID=UPI00301A05C0
MKRDTAAAPAEPRARVPFKVVLVSMVTLWVAYFLLATLSSLLADYDFQDELIIRRLAVCFGGVLVTIGVWLVLRIFDNRSLAAKAAVALIIAFPAALLIAQINQWAFADMEGRVLNKIGEDGVKFRRDAAGNLLVDVPTESEDGEQKPETETTTVTLARGDTPYRKFRVLTESALGRYFLLLAWAALYLALLEGAQARAAERREGEFRRAAKAAELRSLRYQVNPHFLFNTLNSLSALVMTGKAERAEQMIQATASFYRHSLAEEPTADVPLAEEFALQRHYLDIESARFPHRLRFEFDLPGDLANAMVPGMILQPLVENSVKYGVAPVSRIVTIVIKAREEYDRLVLTVSDDGPSVPDTGNHGFGIGLANVADRLEACFGPLASISSGPTQNGYSTQLRMPLERHD